MFRFTIRELVLLTLVVAMGVAWWMDRSLIHRRAEARERQWRFHTIDFAERVADATRDNFLLIMPDGKRFNFVGDQKKLDYEPDLSPTLSDH